MPSVNEHFVGKTDDVRAIYDRLVAMAEAFGPVEQDPKKTSIHLNRQTAFAGVAVRKAHIVLTIKSDRPIKSPRVFKSEQTSAKRFHHEIKLSAIEQDSAQLRNSMKSPELLEPGRVYEYQLDLWQTGITITKGRRLRVEVASAAYPIFSRNLNTGGHSETETRYVAAEQAIYHGAEYPSHVLLPVIPEPTAKTPGGS